MALKRLTIRDFVLVIVVIVWSIVTLTSILTQNAVVLGFVSPVMMVVVTFLLRTTNGTNGNKNGGNK